MVVLYILFLLSFSTYSLSLDEPDNKNELDNKQVVNKYVIGFWPGGMGICMISVLQHLGFCEQENKIPVVYWNKNSLYYTPHGFNGERENVWEYYFQPVSSLKYTPGDRIHNMCGASPSCGKFTALNLHQQELRDRAHYLYTKYIKPKAIVQKKVNDFYTRYMHNKHTIGIHLRGTDILPNGKQVNLQKIADTALQHANENSQFYIMSDDLKLFNKLSLLLNGHKIIAYPCYRSDDGKPLHYNMKRPTFAQMGEDVVIEMLLLSQCDYLVLMQSNVSSVPLIINNKVGFTYFRHAELQMP